MLRYSIFTGGVTPSGANAPAPPRGSLWVPPETLSLPLKAVPLGKVAAPQAMTEGVIIGSAAFCESAALRESEPSPSLLRKSTSPERGRFCSTYRKVPKSSPFGGAGIEQSEMTERVSLRTLPKKAGNISLTLRE